MNKVVLLDIDGVLRNFSQSVWDVLKLEYPEKLPDKKPLNTKWDLMDIYSDFERDELHRLVFDSHLTEEIYYHYAKPYKGAAHFTYLLRWSGYTITMNTHQTRASTIPTMQFLHEHNIVYDNIYVSQFGSKQVFKEGILVDDKPDNLSEGDIWVRRPYFSDFEWDEDFTVGSADNEKTTDFIEIFKILEREYRNE